MLDIAVLILPISLGLLIGLIMALTGAGGGILAVPALTLGLGWSMTSASPVALLTVATAALIGMMSGLLAGALRIRAALLISATGIIAAPVGQHLAQLLPERTLILLFASVMLLVAVRLFSGSRQNPNTTQRPEKTCLINSQTGRINWNLASFLKLCFIGLMSGISTGLLGVGGGFIVVPALLRCSNISMNGIIATSLMVITLVSCGAVISAATMGNLSLNETASLFIGGAAAGMLLGRSLAGKIPATYMQRGLAILITLTSIILYYKVLFR